MTVKLFLNSKLRLVGGALFHAINCKANKSGLSIQTNFYKFDKISSLFFGFISCLPDIGNFIKICMHTTLINMHIIFVLQS